MALDVAFAVARSVVVEPLCPHAGLRLGCKYNLQSADNHNLQSYNLLFAIYILFCVRYGMQIDPINMDEMMGPMDIPIQQGFIHSKARIEGIEIHGLGSMALDKVFLLLV